MHPVYDKSYQFSRRINNRRSLPNDLSLDNFDGVKIKSTQKIHTCDKRGGGGLKGLGNNEKAALRRNIFSSLNDVFGNYEKSVKAMLQ